MRQTLLFDADDTLWENNIFFEESIHDFIGYLNHPHHSAAEVREHLNSIERQRVLVHGYGLKNFRRSLAICHEQLTGLTPSDEHDAEIARCTARIASTEMMLLPGVLETLQGLAGRHALFVVTKGDAEEQREKLARSALAGYFSAVEVLYEKHEAAYRHILETHGLDPERTWMIGNSPKSDVNPSLAAGLNAVYLPHHSTWVLEEEPLAEPHAGRRLLVLDGIARLLEHF